MQRLSQQGGWALCAAVVLTIVWIEWPFRADDTAAPPARLYGERTATRITSDTVLDDNLSQRVATLQARTSIESVIAGVEQSVARGDRAAMAQQLHDLGVLNLASGDLDAADMWFGDALAEYEALGDDAGRARVMLDHGRLHVAFRERARQAAYDYDDLLIARWSVSQGHHEYAQALLQGVIASSLELNRYATAASALTTFYQLHRDAGDIAGALAAGQRALALHASAGNAHLAQHMLQRLERDGLDRTALQHAQTTLDAGMADYHIASQKLGLVRNYTQLYHQLLARGDPVGAWRYRRQAEALRRSASVRARYRRQADVMVELYRSNQRMERAGAALRDAETVFARLGMVEQMLQSAALQADIR